MHVSNFQTSKSRLLRRERKKQLDSPTAILYSRPSPNIDSIRPKRAYSVIRVVVLKRRTQLQLVRTKVQIPIHDSRTIRVLDKPTPHQRLHDVVIRRNSSISTRRRAIDLVADLTLLRIDVVDGVLLARSDVQRAFIISREASLFAAELAGEHDGIEDLFICGREVRHHALRHVVESTRRQHAPVDVAALERDAVGARGCVLFLGPVPAVDWLAVVGSHIFVVGHNDRRVE